MMPSVFVLGLGFLGQPLYLALQQQGVTVAGSRRQGSDVDPNQVALNIDEVGHAPATMARLLAADALVCLLPPSSSAHYADHVMRLVAQMRTQGQLRQVVLASSTSVYGPERRICSEATPTQAHTASAQAMVALEQALNHSALAQVSVLRFGGLFGPERHPVTVLAQKHTIAGANQPVNVVSQRDAVEAILNVLRQPLAPRQLYNICHPEHPSRQAFYQGEADRRGLGTLAFDRADDGHGKIIVGQAYLTDYGVIMADLI